MKSTSSHHTDMSIMLFEKQEDWAAWLSKHHANSSGVWLRLAKKKSDKESVSYVEALETALCYGWIDGQKKVYDEQSWLQKFTPRRPKSIWSKINRTKAEELIKKGSMKPAGLKAVESARQDGRWDAVYDSPGSASVSSVFETRLNRN